MSGARAHQQTTRVRTQTHPRYLEEIGACSLTVREARPGRAARVDASLTYYGELLANLCIPLEAARVVLAGGRAGLLWPCTILAGIMTTTPQPILRPFGRAEQARYSILLRRFSGPGFFSKVNRPFPPAPLIPATCLLSSLHSPAGIFSVRF